MDREETLKHRLGRVWHSTQKDACGAAALAALKKHGFNLARIPFETYTWPGILVSIPFLKDHRARSYLLRPPGGLRVTVSFLREISQALVTPFNNIEAYDPASKTIYMKGADEIGLQLFQRSIEFLEQVRAWRWVISKHNPRQNAIASLRWEIKHRTGKPRDKELLDLVDAVFRTAGFKDGFSMTVESLKKYEISERETRMAARRKLWPDGHPLKRRK